MSTRDVVEYYSGLLIIQYIQKLKAEANIEAVVKPVIMPQATIQVLSFSLVATAGTFKLNYGTSYVVVSWDSSASYIQAQLHMIAGLDAVTVTGSIATQSLTVVFTGVPPLAIPISITENSLAASGTPITIGVAETDVTLPIAVQNAFNMIGDNLAVGKQLDIIGKYAGVKRTGQGFTTQITLDDTDFRKLIQMAIIKNNSGSSLATIQDFLNQFFPDEVFVYDYANMRMSYAIDTSLGSQNLVQLFITEGLLPKPMAVQLASVIYFTPIDNFFGYRTYRNAAVKAAPFNSYADYQMDRPWLSYKNTVTP